MPVRFHHLCHTGHVIAHVLCLADRKSREYHAHGFSAQGCRWDVCRNSDLSKCQCFVRSCLQCLPHSRIGLSLPTAHRPCKSPRVTLQSRPEIPLTTPQFPAARPISYPWIVAPSTRTEPVKQHSTHFDYFDPLLHGQLY